MKVLSPMRLPSLLFTIALSTSSYADDFSDSAAQQTSTNTGNLTAYVANLGAYLGYVITQPPPGSGTPSSTVVSSTASKILGSRNNGGEDATGGSNEQSPFFNLALKALFGSVPVNTLFPQFVPTQSPLTSLNGFANGTFPSYGSAQQTTTNPISVSAAIDQQTYQQDPVSQALLNILSTPDYTYCMDDKMTTWTGGSPTSANSPQYPACAYKYGTLVTNNILGPLPGPGGGSGNGSIPPGFFSSEYNQQFLSQLNSNTLLAPLLYSTTSESSPGSAGGTTQPTQSNNTLPAQNQAQQAANFIRYVTGAVVPLPLPQQHDYSVLYTDAMNLGSNTTPIAQAQAQATLATYFGKLRVYAAQSSVAYSNLYYMLSRRMPQNSGGADSTSTASEALNEFTMATWRLYTPGKDGSTTPSPWLSQINEASPATVQKEMATLLAEINYQLYLNRQQQERLLLTNTMLLIVSSRINQPPVPSVDSGE